MRNKLPTILLIVSGFAFATCEGETPKNIPVAKKEENSRVRCDFKQFDKKKALDAYLKKLEGEVTFEQGDTLFLIPLGACGSCVAMTLDALDLNSFSGKVIVGGKEQEFQEYVPKLDQLRKLPHYTNDRELLMYNYDLGIVGPTILIAEGTGSKYFPLDYAHWSCIADQLGWELSETKDGMH